MKKLIIINGVMGVGKTAVSKELYKRVDKAIWLDGDWCWMMDPFVVNEDTKGMVLDNITHQLQNFINCKDFKHIIFNWVIDEEKIYQDILKSLTGEFTVYKITLMCSAKVLCQRIECDVSAGLRDEGNYERSLAKLEKYQLLSSIKVDTDNRSIDEIVEDIINILG